MWLSQYYALNILLFPTLCLHTSFPNTTKELDLSKRTVTRRVNRGLSRSQACQQQQKLSGAQEKVLLRCIKELTTSSYSPRYKIADMDVLAALPRDTAHVLQLLLDSHKGSHDTFALSAWKDEKPVFAGEKHSQITRSVARDLVVKVGPRLDNPVPGFPLEARSAARNRDIISYNSNLAPL
jgi:hypothetical protein